MFNKNQRTLDSDAHAIQQYIAEHEFGIAIPALSKSLSADEFKQHYYDKKELMHFCRSVGISAWGQKNDLNGRIELYLRTGQVTVVQPEKKSTRPDSESGLSLNKVVVNYKSDPTTRKFFEQNCPGFTGFSAFVQKQIRTRLAESDTFTYGDVIEMHKIFLQNKQAAKNQGQATKVAHDSCQFNQFNIDYSFDPDPRVHSVQDAWMLVRNTAGEKTYQRYKNEIEKIRSILNALIRLP